jgi:NAD(P)-dependent dehydrogenase (short-subunit alcohol dehydrogenase family)
MQRTRSHTTTRIRGATALVTAADSETGALLVETLLAEGARKVYACARDLANLPVACSGFASAQSVVPLELDVLDAASIRSVVGAARDVTLLVNNAGAIVEMCSAFAPVLRLNAPTAIINVVGVAPASETIGEAIAAAFDAVEGRKNAAISFAGDTRLWNLVA